MKGQISKRLVAVLRDPEARKQLREALRRRGHGAKITVGQKVYRLFFGGRK